MPFATIRLGFGQSLIMGNTPPVITSQDISRKMSLEKRETGKLGLFDLAQPNFQTYYPDLKIEDLAPKDAEFVYPTFRLLSEVVVHRKYNPIDFSKPGVLKKSMGMLEAQTVYANHEMAIGNHLGVVQEVSWQESYTTASGKKIPAGINGVLKIDGKSHPNIARGLTMNPPAIHSNSVTVNFAWEKSHPKLSDEEFRAKLGSYDDKGELVRRIVEEVVGYHETSLVAHGADPFAQIINEQGEITNPEYAVRQASLSAFEHPEKSRSQVYWFNHNDTESLSAETHIEPTQTQTMKEILLQLLTAAKVETTGLTEEQLQAKVNELINLGLGQPDIVKERDTLKGKLTAVEADLVASQAKVTALEAEVAAFKAENSSKLNEKRAEVIRLYKILNPKATEEATKVYLEASPEATTTFLTDFNRQVEEKFPAHCAECNSSNIVRNTAVVEEGGEPVKTNKALSDSETAEKLSQKRRSSSVGSVAQMHGKQD